MSAMSYGCCDLGNSIIQKAQVRRNHFVKTEHEPSDLKIADLAQAACILHVPSSSTCLRSIGANLYCMAVEPTFQPAIRSETRNQPEICQPIIPTIDAFLRKHDDSQIAKRMRSAENKPHSLSLCRDGRI